MAGGNKIKVLHFLPRWDNGGMEHAALDIITHFDNKYTYEICAAFLESEFALDSLKNRKIKFTAFYRSKKYNFSDCIKGLYIHLKKNKYDIVHCHVNNAIGLIFAAVAKNAGVNKVVVHTHNNSFGAGKRILKSLLRFFSIVIFRNVPDLFLACSNEAGKWTFGTSVEKRTNYHVIYNGIDQQKFAYNKKKRNELREHYSLNGKFVIGHIGHFNYQKNQAFLLQTIQDVSRKISNVCYFFVGAGELKNDFLREVREKHLESFVIVIDTVTNPQDYYSMFDVFAFPSHFEGFGIVLIEAQISGLKVICSANVSKDTAITENIEYLPIDTNESVHLWAKSIIKCKNNIHEINRTIAQSYKKYEISEISKKIESYYEVLMESD